MIHLDPAVIDIGINQIEDKDGNRWIVGDVDTQALQPIAGWIAPMPGGVGPVIAAMLMCNATCAHRHQVKVGWISQS